MEVKGNISIKKIKGKEYYVHQYLNVEKYLKSL